MCDCPAHRALVDCTCNCDHTNDRLSQWTARALAAEAERDAAHALLRDAAAALDDLGACDVADCDEPNCTRILPRIDALLNASTTPETRMRPISVASPGNEGFRYEPETPRASDNGPREAP